MGKLLIRSAELSGSSLTVEEAGGSFEKHKLSRTEILEVSTILAISRADINRTIMELPQFVIRLFESVEQRMVQAEK